MRSPLAEQGRSPLVVTSEVDATFESDASDSCFPLNGSSLAAATTLWPRKGMSGTRGSTFCQGLNVVTIDDAVEEMTYI